MHYPQEIITNGKIYGYKTANLIYMHPRIEPFNEKLRQRGFKVRVHIPKFIPLAYAVIKEHLDTHAPELNNHWEAFKQAYAAQENKRALGEAAKVELARCQQAVKTCFEHYPLEHDALSQFLSELGPNDKLVIRSTSDKEDKVDRANPGGNTSKVSNPDAESLNEAFAAVIGSSYSLKSISQRIKSCLPGEELAEFEQEQKTPLLIQKLIAEDDEPTMFSGVAYSSEGCSRVQAAPGHGELIVNSLGRFDNYYITRDERVITELMQKTYRYKASINAETQKLSLQEIKNNKSLRDASSLSDEVVRCIHLFCMELETLYGMRMDIEFVYNAKTHTVEIVQARPIPLGDRKDLTPSSIAPAQIKAVKQSPAMQRGKVITPEVLSANVISRHKEIIITENIQDALEMYLRSDEAASNIKAVIVQQDAADTSHEAGEFSSKGIAVLYLDDIAPVRQQLAALGRHQVLVVAPQHKLTTVMTVTDNQQNPEAELYQRGLLQQGIFRSTLSPYVTALPLEFKPSQAEEVDVKPRDIEHFGQLLYAAIEGDLGAQTWLFSYLYRNLINFKLLNQINYATLQEHLDSLADIVFGQDVSALSESLATVSTFITKLKQLTLIPTPLYQQLMLGAGELLLLLERAKTQEGTQNQKLEYLHVLEKFIGLILMRGKKGIFSDSVIQAFEEKSAQRKSKEIFKLFDRAPKQKQEYLTQLQKLSRCILTQQGRKQWQRFCARLATSDTGLPALASLIAKLDALSITGLWLNTRFLDACEQPIGTPAQQLIVMLDEFTQGFAQADELQAAIKMIDTLEQQISHWQEPNYFDQSIEAYEDTITNLIYTLGVYKDEPKIKQMIASQQLYRLIDIMDKTTKSMQKSTLYQNKDDQAQRFSRMLLTFHGLMKSLLRKTYPLYAHGETLASHLQKKSQDPRACELSPSGNFSPTNYQCGYYAATGKNRPMPSCETITLEDLFTLIHQNALVALSVLSKPCGLNESRFPEHCQQLLARMRVGDLIASTYDYPHITLNYNVPLRSHSVSVILKYNVESEEMRATVSAFGGGGNELNRWNAIEVRSNYFMRLHGLKIYRNPRFSPQKDIVSFEVGVSTLEQAEAYRKYGVNDVMKTSYGNLAPTFLFQEDLDSIPLEQLEEISAALKANASQHEGRHADYILNRNFALNFNIATRQPVVDMTQCLKDNIAIINNLFGDSCLELSHEFRPYVSSLDLGVLEKFSKLYYYADDIIEAEDRQLWMCFCDKVVNLSITDEFVTVLDELSTLGLVEHCLNEVFLPMLYKQQASCHIVAEQFLQTVRSELRVQAPIQSARDLLRDCQRNEDALLQLNHLLELDHEMSVLDQIAIENLIYHLIEKIKPTHTPDPFETAIRSQFLIHNSDLSAEDIAWYLQASQLIREIECLSFRAYSDDNLLRPCIDKILELLDLLNLEPVENRAQLLLYSSLTQQLLQLEKDLNRRLNDDSYTKTPELRAQLRPMLRRHVAELHRFVLPLACQYSAYSKRPRCSKCVKNPVYKGLLNTLGMAGFFPGLDPISELKAAMQDPSTMQARVLEIKKIIKTQSTFPMIFLNSIYDWDIKIETDEQIQCAMSILKKLDSHSAMLFLFSELYGPHNPEYHVTQLARAVAEARYARIDSALFKEQMLEIARENQVSEDIIHFIEQEIETLKAPAVTLKI